VSEFAARFQATVGDDPITCRSRDGAKSRQRLINDLGGAHAAPMRAGGKSSSPRLGVASSHDWRASHPLE
jgi:hypothetical protein